MAEKEKKTSYFKDVINFYFAPEIRSAGTTFYLVVFGYFAFYYINNFFLAIKFLIYILSSDTALKGIAYLFTSTIFVLCLTLPFTISSYSIFVLYEIWKKAHWASYAKWIITTLLVLGSIVVIIISDDLSRMIAKKQVMQSFIEDVNLTGRL